MKKTITHLVRLTAVLLVILFTSQTNAQTGCHALFGFNQTANSLTVNFTDSSTSPHTITSWLWDFGDGTTSTSQNPSHTYAHDGTYYVCLTIHDNHGCSNQSCHHITVNPVVTATCHAGFTFHQTAGTLSINFTDASTSSYTITSWLWDFGDGTTSTAQNPSHTYAHDGTYYVCLTIHDNHGCSSTFCHHVTVTPVVTAACHAAFTFHHPANTLSINFTDASSSAYTITSWLWDFGDGTTSTSQNPSHTYAHNGTYYVCLTIHDSHGCSSTFCHHIIVNHHHHALAAQSYLRTPSGTEVVLENPKYILNYPNPFSISTTVQYELTDDANVSIEIYNLIGSKMIQVINENESAGLHSQLVNTDNLNTGIYFIKMNVGDESYMQKISVVK
ncbi:MAG: PKD domain-containing protein [Bacteroidia bacterium]